jgi:multiple sugar transport system permease protein
MNKRRCLSSIGIGAILVIFSIWTLFPFLYIVVTAFKPPGESYTLDFIPWLQFQPTMYSWKVVLGTQGGRTIKALINSITVATVSSFIVLLLGCLAGYALSRFVFKKWKNKDIAIWILSNRMFPPVAIVIPLFLIMRTLRLLDTRSGLIIAHTLYNLPLAVWLMLDFFNELPRDIEEAALVDGCSRLGVFFKIAVPLSASGLVAVYVLCFIFSWSELLFVVSLSYSKAMTLPVMIAGALSVRGLDFWKVSALTLIAVIPPIILATTMSKYLIRGLTLGAVKG